MRKLISLFITVLVLSSCYDNTTTDVTVLNIGANKWKDSYVPCIPVTVTNNIDTVTVNFTHSNFNKGDTITMRSTHYTSGQ